jgi:spore coat polysaccharide biosynthesis protein SpsF
MTRVAAIIQARMSSTRFPGKALQPLLGLPLIVFMAQRARAAKRITDLAVATSTDASDDALADALKQYGIACFRGDLNDVLDRFYQAARGFDPGIVVRLTGDCPLIDPFLIDEVIGALEKEGVDYASNVDPPSFPDGLDVECCRFTALERTWREARLPSEREHVTPFLRARKDLFRAVNVRGLADCSHLRWTVDYPDDLRLVDELLKRAGVRRATDCDRFDFYRVMETVPALAGLNSHARNEGYAQSLAREEP